MTRKHILGSIFTLSLLAAPSITFAAWYNPFTWFTPAPVSESVMVEERSAPTAPTTTSLADKPEPVVQYVEKPVIKEVIRTVTQTVENPATRQQLQDALAKNTQLTNQIQEYQNLIKQYESANQQLNSKYADAVGVAAQCVAQLKSQPSYTPPSNVFCRTSYSTFDNSAYTYCQ